MYFVGNDVEPILLYVVLVGESRPTGELIYNQDFLLSFLTR